MEFKPEQVNDFLRIFNASKHHIRAFPGCLYLELLRDAEKENVFFTYSQWNTPQDLENYRLSELFQNTWAQTKVLFQAKPMAFSLITEQVIHT
jgi:quinol monooxygenase YgiN